MVKADLSRDYYADLGLQPSAGEDEIKKAFKKLALQHHPDRNPGQEERAVTEFQKINSAHEVLTDKNERARYDANRTRSNARYQTGGNARGNPWSNVSSQFPTPPKPPTARRPQPPPPSAGAQRYKNFETPKQSANQQAQEGAQARTNTYYAWEKMRNDGSAGRTSSQGTAPNAGPGKSWAAPGPVPKGTPKSGREESNNMKHPPPPNRAPGFEEFNRHYSNRPDSPRRAQSTNASARKGFMPNTPGGDEPAGPRGNYFTDRNKPAQAPPPPPRNSYMPGDVPVDPLRQFREHHRQEPLRYAYDQETTAQTRGHHEPRMSTPYTTHGGEKFDPFEKSNMARSRSTREPRASSFASGIPRSGSDSNLNSPHNNSNQKPPKFSNPAFVEDDDTSSDEGPVMKHSARQYAKPRNYKKPPSADSSSRPEPRTEVNTPQRDTVEQTQKSSDTSQPSQQQTRPSMYGISNNNPFRPACYYPFRGPQKATEKTETSIPSPYKPLDLDREYLKVRTPPSGRLYPVEEFLGASIQSLLNGRSSSTSSATVSTHPKVSRPSEAHQDPVTEGSPSKKHRTIYNGNLYSSKPVEPPSFHLFDQKLGTDSACKPRFSFPVDDKTFQRTDTNGFKSNSTENVNTKFTPEEWNGKSWGGTFVGSSFSEQAATNSRSTARTRTQSGSRSRGRSPTKFRPMDTHYDNQTEEPPVDLQNGTKFSKEQWASTFKPNTFMPPPHPTAQPPSSRPLRKPRGASLRSTMGNAAMVDDENSPDDKTRPTQPGSSMAGSPDAMDVDDGPAGLSTPLPKTPIVPIIDLTQASPQKRAATSSAPSPTEANLKAVFDDMKVQELMADVPQPPPRPEMPTALNKSTPIRREDYDAYLVSFAQYMKEYDLYNTRFILHFVSRKNINSALGPLRWTDNAGIASYREGLEIDASVLKAWSDAGAQHAAYMKVFAVLREQMKVLFEGKETHARKKTH